MAKLQIKKSNETGKVPQPGDLDWGELALNYTDGKLFYKKHGTNTVELLNPPDTNTVTRLRGTTDGTYTSGDLTLVAGTNITITQSGSDYTIASAGGADSTKLPLAGGTLTGPLTLNIGAGFGRINALDQYHSVIMRGSVAGTTSQTVTASDTMEFIEYGGVWNFRQVNTSTNKIWATVNTSGISWDGNSVLHAGNYNSYALPLAGGTLAGALSITDATQSSSTSTGSFITAGGVGIAKNLYVGNTIYITRAIEMSTTNNGLYHVGNNMSFDSPANDTFRIVNGRAAGAYPATLLFKSGYAGNTYGAVVGGGGEIRLETNRGNAFTSTATNTAIADQAGANRIIITGDTTQIYNNLTLENSGSLTAGAISASNITITGELRGPATMYIDPAAVGDNTGTLVIRGNLQVDGTTTTINSTTVAIDDLNLQLATDAANAAAANGAGITIGGASATFNYASSGDKWQANKSIETSGQLISTVATGTSPLAVTSTTAVTNLNADLLDGNHASAFALSGHTHSYLPLSGGTLTGSLLINGTSATSVLTLYVTGSTQWNLGVGDNSGTNFNISADFGTFTINKLNGNVTTPGQFYAGTTSLVINTGNKDNYTYPPASHTHNYLPLSGGTLTGATAIQSSLSVQQYNEASYSKWAYGWGGVQDLNWYRVATLKSTVTDGWRGTSGKITVFDENSNHGVTTRSEYTAYFAIQYSSGGTALDNPYIYFGPGASTYIRLFKVGTRHYEVQVRQISDWRLMGAILEIDENSGNLSVFETSLQTASTTGTVVASSGNAAEQLNIVGNSGTATTLETARTLTIGNTGKTFNGSANVTWTLAEIGAYAATNPSGYTSNTGTVTSVGGTGTVSGLTLSGTVTTSGNLTLSGTLSASIDNITDEHRIFNNMGDNHGTRNAFDATTPSYNFGWRFVQGNTNGPGVNSASQYYSLYVGLGNEYPATGAGSYGMQLAIPRNVSTPYLCIRYNESNSLAGWQKISAGYADTAGSATDNTKLPLTGGTLTGNLVVDGTEAWNAANAMLNVGGTGDGRLQVRHIWGKEASSAGVDHLWLNYQNTGKHVQIGDSGGGNNLYVIGDIYAGGYFTGNLVINTANKANYTFPPESHSHSYLPLSGGTLTGNLEVTGNSPNVKIRPTSGTVSYLQLTDNSTSGYLLKNTTNATDNGALAGALYTYTDSNKAFQHIHSGTPLFTILSTGNVGIASVTPSEKLEVSGNILVFGSGSNSAGSGTNIWLGPANNSRDIGIRRGGTAIMAFDRYNGGWYENARFHASGNFSIGNANDNGYKLEVNGSFAATTKSFVINHPTKPGKKLRYGSLEGPENGVYVRGRLRGTKIELPDYWAKLVDPDSITVQLTPHGRRQDIWVTKIENNCVYVSGITQPDCYYFIQAERVDVDKLQVEID